MPAIGTVMIRVRWSGACLCFLIIGFRYEAVVGAAVAGYAGEAC